MKNSCRFLPFLDADWPSRVSPAAVAARKAGDETQVDTCSMSPCRCWSHCFNAVISLSGQQVPILFSWTFYRRLKLICHPAD